jgi:hypothetical protein
LGSHPEICGYRELHRPYRHSLDLFKARVALFEDRSAYSQARYLLDKILHNEWEFKQQLFANKSKKYIFVLRQPERCMLSMIKRHLENNDKETVHIQYDYYIARMNALETYWHTLEGDKLFIDSDWLIQSKDTVLENVSQFLGLREPLSSSYQVFSKTGIAGVGDMSKNIGSGQIIDKVKPLSEADKELLNLIKLEPLIESYENLKAKMNEMGALSYQDR